MIAPQINFKTTEYANDVNEMYIQKYQNIPCLYPVPQVKLSDNWNCLGQFLGIL